MLRNPAWTRDELIVSLDFYLRHALSIPGAYHRGEAADFAAEAERLRREATYHLATVPCRMRTTGGCRTNSVGTMTGATCCVSWMIQALSRPTTVLKERSVGQ